MDREPPDLVLAHLFTWPWDSMTETQPLLKPRNQDLEMKDAVSFGSFSYLFQSYIFSLFLEEIAPVLCVHACVRECD